MTTKKLLLKKRRIKFEYEEINTFNTVEELEKFQETLKNQGLHKKSETEGGWENIITYECKETKRGCKYVLIIKTSHENSVSTVRHRICGHDHSNSKSSGLTKEIKELILAHSHLTATRIQKKLKVS
uniref:GIY-YIG homing endonuclease n=1 Tax=Panagrolaimus superbus TaxID=310955 RepID=A0A914YL13_9BILA